MCVCVVECCWTLVEWPLLLLLLVVACVCCLRLGLNSVVVVVVVLAHDLVCFIDVTFSLYHHRLSMVYLAITTS